MPPNVSSLKVGALDHGNQRAVLPIADSQSMTGNATISPNTYMRELLIANDDTVNNLTFTINGDDGYSVSFTLQPLDILDERYYPFNQVVVTAVGNWRYELRCGEIQ